MARDERMKRLAAVLALVIAAALPVAAPAAKSRAAADAPVAVRCASGDPVVWLNTETKVYHLSGSRYYGKTKHGKYLCRTEAAKAGARLAKSEGATTKAAGTSVETPEPDATGTTKKHRKARATPAP